MIEGLEPAAAFFGQVHALLEEAEVEGLEIDLMVVSSETAAVTAAQVIAANLAEIGQSFTAFYSAIPEHVEHFKYLYVGLEGHRELVPWMWLSAALVVLAAIVLLNPRLRGRQGPLTFACVAVVLSIWIEKGLGMINVRLYRPFSSKHLLAAIPESVKSIAVLDRTKEPGSIGEPMYQSIRTAIGEGMADGLTSFDGYPLARQGQAGKALTEHPAIRAVALVGESATGSHSGTKRHADRARRRAAAVPGPAASAGPTAPSRARADDRRRPQAL